MADFPPLGEALHPAAPPAVPHPGRGLSGAALKWIALVLMVLDHLELLFPAVFPPLFHWAGRLSAPLFYFLLAEGFWRTHSRGRYLLRLYLASAGCELLFRTLTHGERALRMNIFAALFWVFLLGTASELVRALFARRAYWQGGLVICGAAGAAILLSLLPQTALVRAFLPSPLFVEGGLPFLLFGLGLLLCRRERRALVALFLLFSGYWLLVRPVQALMILALPLILCYNGERGRQPKCFFYLFYPAHLLFLYFIG